MRISLLVAAIGLSLLVAIPALFSACASTPRFAATASDGACPAARRGEGGFAGADPARGRAVFDRDCAACHSLMDDRSRPNGPHLQGVVSRRVGAVDGFRYSSAFGGRDDRWTLDALDRYLEAPEWYYPGTRMRYDGLVDPDERRDLLAFLACETD